MSIILGILSVIATIGSVIIGVGIPIMVFVLLFRAVFGRKG